MLKLPSEVVQIKFQSSRLSFLPTHLPNFYLSRLSLFIKKLMTYI